VNLDETEEIEITHTHTREQAWIFSNSLHFLVIKVVFVLIVHADHWPRLALDKKAYTNNQ
jgi:hypothetical protein